jgi:hypothetical protein
VRVGPDGKSLEPDLATSWDINSAGTVYYNPFVNAVNKSVHGFSESPLGYFNLQGVTKS